MRIPIGGRFYASRSKPLSSQRCVNYYYEPPPKDAKSPEFLIGTPGLTVFANIGSDRIYGMHEMNGGLYVVSGNSVYYINQYGGGTPLGTMGTVSDVVITADNGTNVILVKEDGAAYLATPTTLTQITDGDFQSASSVTVLDGFAIFTKLNTTQYFISALNDASSYDALDIASAEESPDKLVRAFANHSELWLFGEKSIEVHYNSGSGDFPFIPIGGAAIQRGCAAKRSVAQEDNTLFWLGEDRVVYRANGYLPSRISTHGIEKEIQAMSTIDDAEAFIYTQEGHKFYCLTFPTELVTFCYDIATGEWHQRQSFGKGRWRATCFAFAYGKNLVGDFESGTIYELDLDTYTENTETIQRIVTFPTISNNKQRITHSSLLVDFDTGVGLLSGQGSDPQAVMRFSDDGGNTWSNERWRTLGATGEYKTRAIWRRNGFARDRVYEISVTDPVKCNITGAFINEND